MCGGILPVCAREGNRILQIESSQSVEQSHGYTIVFPHHDQGTGDAMVNGERLLVFRSERSAIFTIEWELKTQTLVAQAYQCTDLRVQERKPNGGRSKPRHTRRARPQDA